MNSPHPPAADTPSPEPAGTPARPASSKRRRKATGALVIAAGLLGAGAIATAVVPEPQVATAQQDQAALIAEGKSIYDVACITCHGQNLQGVQDRGPSLVGTGSGATYFQVHSGRMPAANNEAQAQRKKPRYSEHQIVALAAYVDLAAHSRGRSVAELIEVRQGDIEALARALDLDAADLAQQVQDVLGATRAEAIRLVQRLRETRVIGGITKAATAGMLAGSLLAGSGAVAAATPAHDGAATAPPAAAPDRAPTGPPRVDGPLTVTDDGVGLIPAAAQDHGGGVQVPPTIEEPEGPGVVLLPPATVERDDPTGR